MSASLQCLLYPWVIERVLNALSQCSFWHIADAQAGKLAAVYVHQKEGGHEGFRNVREKGVGNFRGDRDRNLKTSNAHTINRKSVYWQLKAFAKARDFW
ncbi:hypothetical protein FORC17_p028 (plasmid) [Vibrio vulnificus]|nr:hypothetical protein FORC17_p028 [Vibrio vulnificus]